MITHVQGPFERLKERLAYRFSTWLDTLCADQPEPKVGGVPAAAPLPPTKGLPAVLRALEQGADGSVRRLARDLGSSKSTVHRAKRKMLAHVPAAGTVTEGRLSWGPPLLTFHITGLDRTG